MGGNIILKKDFVREREGSHTEIQIKRQTHAEIEKETDIEGCGVRSVRIRCKYIPKFGLLGLYGPYY